MTQWSESEINATKMNVRCPGEGCKYFLWDDDVKSLVSKAVFLRYKERKSRGQLEHLHTALAVGDPKPALGPLKPLAVCPNLFQLFSASFSAFFHGFSGLVLP
jgi:hypothetical protein